MQAQLSIPVSASIQVAGTPSTQSAQGHISHNPSDSKAADSEDCEGSDVEGPEVEGRAVLSIGIALNRSGHDFSLAVEGSNVNASG
jgi:hypothetical protein